MQLQKISVEDLRNDSARNYNPAEWDKAIDRMLADDTNFYVIRKGTDGYDYDRFYCVYTMPNEGFKVLRNFGYSGMLTNRPFRPIFIDENTGEVTKLPLTYPNDKLGRSSMKIVTDNVPNVIFTTVI